MPWNLFYAIMRTKETEGYMPTWITPVTCIVCCVFVLYKLRSLHRSHRGRIRLTTVVVTLGGVLWLNPAPPSPPDFVEVSMNVTLGCVWFTIAALSNRGLIRRHASSGG